MMLLTRIFNLSCKNLNGNLFRAPTTSFRLPRACYVSIIPSKRPMREEKYATSDKVPNGFKMIYRAPMEVYIKLSKYVSGSTAFLIGGLALFKFATDQKYIELSKELDLGGLVTHDSDIWWFAAGFIAINASIMFCISKFPLRIYKNEKRYLAIYEGLLPFSVNRHNFKQGEVKQHKNVFNPWSFITYRIRNKSSLLLLDYFKTPSEFHEMCKESK